MMTHRQKADYYDKMYDLLENGWTKGKLFSYDSFCLVGAANAVTSGNPRQSGRDASKELQRDMTNAILLRNPARAARSWFGMRKSPDGGLVAVESWNDHARRNKDQVLKFVASRRDFHDSKAGVNRVALLEQQAAEYEKQIGALHNRIATLEAENAALRAEVVWWKARRAKVTPKELTAANKELADLDRELDATLLKMTRMKAAV